LLTSDEDVVNAERPVVTFENPIPPGKTAEGLVSFAAPATQAALDLQIAVAGPNGEATGFIFGVPQPQLTTPSPSPSPSAEA
jgi:hypothetical protein